MTTPTSFTLPTDLTGTSKTNFIASEPHTLPTTGNAAFVPSYGPYFERSLVIRALPSGTTLTSDQYQPIQLFIDATMASGQPVCSIIVIKDPQTTGLNYEIDYQAVGGDYSESVNALTNMVDALEIDNRSVLWGDIIGKPEQYAPTPHLHDLGDIYGFEYMVVALERIRNAIVEGDDASHDSIYQYINEQISGISGSNQNTESELQSHLSDYGNPHKTTATQVGLGNVQNYGIASTADAQAGTADNLYMTPLKTSQAISSQVGNSLNSHISNTNNPHQTTKTQVGLGNVVNNSIATLTEAQSGIGSNYMTAALTSQAISSQVGNTLNSHISNTNNPHQTTATQVGLGNVQNFGIANSQQAIDGTDNSSYMTPALVRTSVNANGGTQLQNHVNNTNNPHQTSAAQVGLGSVQNFGIADTNTATAGTADNAYMTPLKTSQAISSQVGNTLNSHISNTNNPHQTTKTQVGLGSVQNFGIADTNTATAGTADNAYMTPLKTSQAISSQVGNTLNSHISNTNNPHQTSAAQVGLGNVQNFGIADTNTAIAGTSNTAYMTPANTFSTIQHYIDLIYPVGSYHQTESSISPQTNFPWQTWTLVTGRILVGFDNSQTEFNQIGKTGGEKTHTLTISEIPQLNFGANGFDRLLKHTGVNTIQSIDSTDVSGSEPELTTSSPIPILGGGQSHNNLQPYRVVNMWRRTA